MKRFQVTFQESENTWWNNLEPHRIVEHQTTPGPEFIFLCLKSHEGHKGVTLSPHLASQRRDGGSL